MFYCYCFTVLGRGVHEEPSLLEKLIRTDLSQMLMISESYRPAVVIIALMLCNKPVVLLLRYQYWLYHTEYHNYTLMAITAVATVVLGVTAEGEDCRNHASTWVIKSIICSHNGKL